MKRKDQNLIIKVGNFLKFFIFKKSLKKSGNNYYCVCSSIMLRTLTVSKGIGHKKEGPNTIYYLEIKIKKKKKKTIIMFKLRFVIPSLKINFFEILLSAHLRSNPFQ